MITLGSFVGTLFTIILEKAIKSKIEETIEDMQCGLRNERCNTDKRKFFIKEHTYTSVSLT